MVDVSTSQWESLEKWSPTGFLVAGVLLVVFAAFLGYEAFTDTSAPEDIFGPPGFFLAMIGLLGLYPRLADRTPRLARAGAVGATIGAVGWLLITVFAITEVVELLPALEEMAIFGAIIIVVAGIGMIVAYIGTGVASLRSNVHPLILGFLLLTPPIIFGVMLTQAVLFAQFGLFSETSMAWSAVALSGGQALAHVGVGYLLRTEIALTDRAEPAPDTTAR